MNLALEVLSAAIASIVSFVLCFAGTKRLITYLASKKMTVLDFHKADKRQVPRPGGPALIAAIVVGEGILFGTTQSIAVLALLIVTLLSGLIGLIDDLKTLGGIAKPALLSTVGLPVLALEYLIPESNVFNHHLYLPLFSVPTNLALIYPLLVLIAIPVATNTINTVDVLNGVASGTILIALVPVAFGISLRILEGKGSPIALLAVFPLYLSLIAFFFFHRYPSRIFPGDSGSLALGGAYATISIIGGVEIVAVIAILPAILNSFFFLSTVKRLVEHRQIKTQPTGILPDGTMFASRDTRAPTTLLRMVLATRPMKEDLVVREIFKLAAISAVLSAVTAILTWVVVIG
jgi:UDP-N-acetylmuramyl pentapeptide phosphotransferase/UDP-N-acetylglucosamine-1-phosphate transferase